MNRTHVLLLLLLIGATQSEAFGQPRPVRLDLPPRQPNPAKAYDAFEMINNTDFDVRYSIRWSGGQVEDVVVRSGTSVTHRREVQPGDNSPVLRFAIGRNTTDFNGRVVQEQFQSSLRTNRSANPKGPAKRYEFSVESDQVGAFLAVFEAANKR